MFIWLAMILITPGVFAALLFYRFTGAEGGALKRLAVGACFVFFVNLLATAAAWLMGHTYINWSLNGDSVLYSASFCVKYMLISTGFAFLLSLAAAALRALGDADWFKIFRREKKD